MWSALAGLVLGIIRWLFGGRQQTEGVVQGRAEQMAADATSAAHQQEAVAASEAKDVGATADDVETRMKDGSF